MGYGMYVSHVYGYHGKFSKRCCLVEFPVKNVFFWRLRGDYRRDNVQPCGRYCEIKPQKDNAERRCAGVSDRSEGANSMTTTVLPIITLSVILQMDTLH